MQDLTKKLAGPGLALRTGPLVTLIRSRLRKVADGIFLHYAEHPLEPPECFVDFHVSIVAPGNLRRWMHPQVLFQFDDNAPFHPLPANQAYAMLEWGLNWCISDQLPQLCS